LAEHEGRLSLNGLTSLSAEAAQALAKHKGDLGLGGLTSLSAEAAQALAKHKGDLHLYLDGLTSLSAEVAQALAKHEGWLSLDGLTSEDKQRFEILREQHRAANETLTLEIARQLIEDADDFVLIGDGYSAITDGAAQALAEHEGELYLNGLTSLSAEAAQALAKHKGDLYLYGLTNKQRFKILREQHQAQST